MFLNGKKAIMHWNPALSTGSWADRSPLHDAASQGRLLALRNLILQVNFAIRQESNALMGSSGAALKGKLLSISAALWYKWSNYAYLQLNVIIQVQPNLIVNLQCSNSPIKFLFY